MPNELEEAAFFAVRDGITKVRTGDSRKCLSTVWVFFFGKYFGCCCHAAVLSSLRMPLHGAAFSTKASNGEPCRRSPPVKLERGWVQIHIADPRGHFFILFYIMVDGGRWPNCMMSHVTMVIFHVCGPPPSFQPCQVESICILGILPHPSTLDARNQTES